MPQHSTLLITVCRGTLQTYVWNCNCNWGTCIVHLTIKPRVHHESVHILVPVNRIKQKWFQIATKRVCWSQHFQLHWSCPSFQHKLLCESVQWQTPVMPGIWYMPQNLSRTGMLWNMSTEIRIFRNKDISRFSIPRHQYTGSLITVKCALVHYKSTLLMLLLII